MNVNFAKWDVIWLCFALPMLCLNITFFIFNLERPLLQRFNLPFGSSLIAVLQKD